MKPPALLIDRVIGLVVPHFFYRHDIAPLVVEHQCLAIDVNDDDGVVEPKLHVAQYDDAQMLRRYPGGAKQQVLGDRIILTLAALGEELERCFPVVALAPIAERRDIRVTVDGGVDALEFRPQVEPGDLGEESPPCRGLTAFLRGRTTACKRLLLLCMKAHEHVVPFDDLPAASR